jgi:putative ABC transport system ATP-binding protein
MNDGSILNMNNISMSYGGRRILENFSMTVDQNETAGISGPSGSGKSTILRIAIDLESPESGEVIFLGKNVKEWDPQELRRCMILVPQEAVMFPGTVRDNLQWGLRIRGEEASDEKLVSVLREVDLKKRYLDEIAENLSGGEKQRVAIARALLLEPKALLLDEPTSALDKESTLVVEDSIKKVIEERNMGVVIVTHNRSQSERFTNRIIELEAKEEED